MADKNFKGGPGGRLKREEEKNTLYVNNPNDPRLKMYQDSLQAVIPSILSNKHIIYMNTLLMDKRRDYYENDRLKNPKFQAPKSSYEARNRLENANKKPYTIINDESLETVIEPQIGYAYKEGSKPEEISKIRLYGSKKQLPKRKVVYKREDLEPIAPRQAIVPQFEQPQIIAPVMRPVSVPEPMPMEEPIMEEDVVTERPVSRKPPKAVMPSRQGGWGNQPLLMKLFPKLYEK
jgi:hypothetical protein